MKHFTRTGVSTIMNTSMEIVALKRHGVEFPVELTISQHRYGDECEFCAFIMRYYQNQEICRKTAVFSAL